MKNMLFLLLFAPLTLVANQGNPSLEAIAKALSTGDVETLSKYFADNVEVSILDKEQLYPRAKATEAVRSFFNTNKPKSFSQVHQGSSRENSDQYCIGNLSAATGSNASIEEIRFDRG